MQKRIAKAAAAAAVIGFLGVGSMQLANAQEDPTTTTTLEESTDSSATTDTTVADDTTDTTVDDSTTDDATGADEDCPKDGAGRPDGSSDTCESDTSTTVEGS